MVAAALAVAALAALSGCGAGGSSTDAALQAAAGEGDVVEVRARLESGDANQRVAGVPLIFAAVESGSLETFEAVLAAGGDPTVLSEDGDNLITAALFPDNPPAMLDRLLELGLDPCFAMGDRLAAVSGTTTYAELARVRGNAAAADLLDSLCP